MTDKQTAARTAAEAGDVAAQAINDYGLDSKQARGATKAAADATERALRAGCTRTDIVKARRNRR